MQNVYLIGMMGAGKTATGRSLAALTQMDFVDLDEEIEGRTHRSINEIFETRGEPFFRAEEKELLRRISSQGNSVVATGGGIVLDPGNVAQMKSSGKIVYLAASPGILWERVRDKRDRPLLKAADPRATFHQLFGERKSLYESSCDAKIATDGLTAEVVARKIVDEVLKS